MQEGNNSSEYRFWKELAQAVDPEKKNTISIPQLIVMLEVVGSPASEKEIDFILEEFEGKAEEMSIDTFAEWITSEDKKIRDLLPKDALRKYSQTESFDFFLHHGLLHFVEEVDKSQIKVIERNSGQEVEEPIPHYTLFSRELLFSPRIFKRHKEAVKKLIRHMSQQQLAKFDAPESTKFIPDFVKFNNLKPEEFTKDLSAYNTFNEFFFRELKPGLRPVAHPDDPTVCVSPADCRCVVYHNIQEAQNFFVKGRNFTMSSLLQDEQLAKEFEDGELGSFRLCPQDYHRFHTPVDGTVQWFKDIPGTVYPVNDFCVRNPDVDVYTENKRSIMCIESPQFGKVLYISVGAVAVGSINWLVKKDDQLKRGDEVGYFAYGGSLILLLFKKNVIQWDKDLLANSHLPMETKIQCGDCVGKLVSEQ